jgi:hypothetical protein
LKRIAIAFGFGAPVQASVRFSELRAFEPCLALAKLIEIDDLTHASVHTNDSSFSLVE